MMNHNYNVFDKSPGETLHSHTKRRSEYKIAWLTFDGLKYMFYVTERT